LGQAVIELGGGRKKAEDKLDLSVGLDQFIRIGKYVDQGDPLLRIHTSNDRDMERAKNLLSEAFQFSENPVESNPLILESIT
jgi:thymidine phosphorylase